MNIKIYVIRRINKIEEMIVKNFESKIAYQNQNSHICIHPVNSYFHDLTRFITWEIIGDNETKLLSESEEVYKQVLKIMKDVYYTKIEKFHKEFCKKFDDPNLG